MLAGDLLNSLPRMAPCVRTSLVDAIRSMDGIPADRHECLAAALHDLFEAADHLFGTNEDGHAALCRSIVRLIALQRATDDGELEQQ